MAKFIGTVDEFKKYMSGYCRNTVQVLAKKYTKDIGKCEPFLRETQGKLGNPSARDSPR